MLAMLPAVNATLNGLAACLLVAGWVAIRRKNVDLHKRLMIAAFAVSALFLASYLTYHIGRAGAATVFPGQGIWRTIYLWVLIPHIILAVVMLPMIFVTFYRAFRGQFDRHRWIARITLPIWLYVSVTGVVVYVMLYRITWN